VVNVNRITSSGGPLPGDLQINEASIRSNTDETLHFFRPPTSRGCVTCRVPQRLDNSSEMTLPPIHVDVTEILRGTCKSNPITYEISFRLHIEL